MIEKSYRSILKALSWRVLGTFDTMLISFLITGKLTWAVSIGFIEVFTKTALYFIHERIWTRVSLGLVKEQPVDYQI